MGSEPNPAARQPGRASCRNCTAGDRPGREPLGPPPPLARGGPHRRARPDVEPRGQRPDQPLGPRRAAVRRLHPRDERAGRLDLPHLQRRAALSQADPDLLADARRASRSGATTRSAPGSSRRSPGTATCLLVLALGRRMFGPRAGFLAALMLDDRADHGHRVEAGDDRRDARPVRSSAASSASGNCRGGPRSGWPRRFWVLLALATLTKGPVGPGADRRRAGVVSWWWGGPTAMLAAAPLAVGAAAVRCWSTAPWYVAVGSRLARRVLPVRARQADGRAGRHRAWSSTAASRAITW